MLCKLHSYCVTVIDLLLTSVRGGGGIFFSYYLSFLELVLCKAEGDSQHSEVRPNSSEDNAVDDLSF